MSVVIVKQLGHEASSVGTGPDPPQTTILFEQLTNFEFPLSSTGILNCPLEDSLTVESTLKMVS